MEKLNDEYWSERYRSGETGWDMQQVSPPLQAYFEQLTNKDARILIPGCGNAYEAEWLAQHGFTDITLIDISSELVQRLQQRLAHYPAIRVLHQDFFTHEGQYDLIIEQTFFCALAPALRGAYALHMKQLLNAKGRLAGVLFNTIFEQGPPFGGSEREYRQLFEPFFRIKVMAPCYNSIAKRMGNELFVVMEQT